MKATRIAVAFALGLAAPGMAEAIITLDPTTSPMDQGYETEGAASFQTGPRFRIDDAGPDRRLFFKAAPELEAAGAVSVEVDVRLEGTVVPNGEDTGVHFVLNCGEVVGTEIRVACVQRGTERRISIKDSGGLFTPGIACDWTTAVQFTIEKTAAGEGAISFNGQSEVVPAVGLAAATRVAPAFEFGCMSGPARVLATFGPIGDPLVSVPAGTSLAAVEVGVAKPNPFGSTTSIMYALAQPGAVHLSVYDISGREVTVLQNGPRNVGEFTTMWDGRDAVGRQVAAGVYFLRLESGATGVTSKLVLLR